MYQNVVRCRLFTLVCVRVRELQRQIMEQVWYISFDDTEQVLVTCFPCSVHQPLPFRERD